MHRYVDHCVIVNALFPMHCEGRSSTDDRGLHCTVIVEVLAPSRRDSLSIVLTVLSRLSKRRASPPPSLLLLGTSFIVGHKTEKFGQSIKLPSMTVRKQTLPF